MNKLGTGSIRLLTFYAEVVVAGGGMSEGAMSHTR